MEHDLLVGTPREDDMAGRSGRVRIRCSTRDSGLKIETRVGHANGDVRASPAIDVPVDVGFRGHAHPVTDLVPTVASTPRADHVAALFRSVATCGRHAEDFAGRGEREVEA